MNVVKSAMMTIIENSAGEMTPMSRPISRMTSSIRPRVFIRTPSPDVYKRQVYELSPNASGEYEETVLHNFQRYNSTDGWQPFSGVILDASGNVYGTAESGGTNGFGMVFELTPGSDGQWTETVLHNFTLKDGARPWSALIADASGNLYGTAAGGGKYASGVVFELMRVNGGWVETTLHDFNPVSYTHLDVYKRQGMKSSSTTIFLPGMNF